MGHHGNGSRAIRIVAQRRSRVIPAPAGMLNVGDTFVSRFTISDDEVRLFIALSGDANIIHIDPEAAATSPLKRLAVPGILAAAKLSGIHGTQFPGHGTVYRWVRLDWYSPMITAVEYVATITVTELKPARHRGIIDTEITEADGGRVVGRSVSEVVHLTLF